MNNWHILTISHGGTLSLLKNLTYEEARGVMRHMDYSGDPYSDAAIIQRARSIVESERYAAANNGWMTGSSGFHYSPNPGDIKTTRCWGPEGEKMIVWPIPDDYEEKYQCALNAARIEL